MLRWSNSLGAQLREGEALGCCVDVAEVAAVAEVIEAVDSVGVVDAANAGVEEESPLLDDGPAVAVPETSNVADSVAPERYELIIDW